MQGRGRLTNIFSLIPAVAASLFSPHLFLILSFVFSRSHRPKMAMSRTAIALNNMSVEMLHRHLFQEALSTLQDATRLLRQHLNKQSSISDEESMLRRAQLRLCQPKAVSNTDRNYPGFKDLMDDPLSFLHVMKNYAQDHPPPNILYTIRISDIDTACYEDVDMQSAILLYNTGLANHLAMQSPRAMTSLMKLADGLLQAKVTPYENELIFPAAIIQLAIRHCCSTLPQLSHLSQELSPRACKLAALLLPHDALSAAAA
jgi:hypothetical protein